MKITKVTAAVDSAAKRQPIRDALQTLDRDGYCHVRIETDAGVTGVSSTYFGRVASSPGILADIIEEQYAPAIVGMNPVLIRDIRSHLRRLTDYQGTAGLATYAISAVDVALWDLAGKRLGIPVWQMLGAQRTAIPTYAMVGWLELGIPELERVAGTAMEQGFLGVKVKVGGGSLQDDLQRISAVRAVIGADVPLMVDANQAFGFAEALRRGKAYEDIGCEWFEEPIAAYRTEDHIRLAERLNIPIAAGENRYGLADFTQLVSRGGVGVVQPDLRRAGGLTDCLEIGYMAAGFDIPYASHGGGPHIHALAALPNAIYMESGLLKKDSPVTLVNGCYPLPEEPGLSGWA